ncbi:hypothetical protein ACJ73_02456 [Blastomyces percursus]|uniref:BAG domain-containing protein n=1 Tax=Blastomyces percursus TaxID=1658174 RepID=A0A1J9R181_9EURO|nr:hypothetical protein ACJ73_02456 [Blastomyces percursus]
MTVVSSHFSSLSATSASYLESLATHLPDSVRSAVSRFAITLCKVDPTSSSPLWLDSLAKPFEVLLLLTTSTPTTRVAVTLLLALSLTVLAMSWNPWRERLSPYRNTSPPTVADDDYSYVTVDDADYIRARHNLGYSPTEPRSNQHPLIIADDDESKPDVIILKYRGKSYCLNFPAYSIGDGLITVGNVKLAAANALDVPDTRQIKLLYKGTVLRDDSARAKDVGLKQNSATMCVISDFLPDTSSEESLVTPATYDMPETTDQQSPSPPFAYGGSGGGDGRKKRRNKKRSNNNAATDTQPSAQSASTPFAIPIERPQQQHPQRAPKQSPPSSYTSSSPSLSSRPLANDNNRPISSASTSPRPSRIPKPSPNLNLVRTPQEKISLLSSYFHETLEPLIREYIQHPPGEQKSRDFEHRKLSETTMMQVILKVDGIDVDGDEEARQQRRALIVTVQNLLKLLDDAHGHG